MNKCPIAIMLISLCFFMIFLSLPMSFNMARSSISRNLPGIPQGDSGGAVFWRALIVGDDRGFNRSDKRKFYQLGLGHLFTPSGVHLSTLQPILKHIRFLPIFYFMLACLLSFTPGLAALSRVSWLKTVSGAQKKFVLFFLIIIFEGYIFSWKSHGLSWTCSFLFLGLCWFAPKDWRPIWFILGQLLLCWVLNQPYSLIAPFIGLVVGLILVILFPTLLLLSLIPPFNPHEFLLVILDNIYGAIVFVDKVHNYLPPLMPHFGHLLLGVSWVTISERRWLALILVFLTTPLSSEKKWKESMSKNEFTPSKNAVVISNNNISLIYSDGTKCKHRWKNGLWRESCRPPGGRRQRL